MRKMALLAVIAAASVGVACGDDGTGGSGGTGGDASGGSGGDATGGNSTGGNATGGNASGGNASGGAQSSFAEYCDARSALCQNDAVACKAQETCALGFLRDEIETSLFACLEGSCDEEACLAQATQNPSPAATAARTKCLERHETCQGTDDICFSLPVLSDAVVAQFAACLDLADCNAVNTCLSDQSDVIDECDSWL